MYVCEQMCHLLLSQRLNIYLIFTSLLQGLLISPHLLILTFPATQHQTGEKKTVPETSAWPFCRAVLPSHIPAEGYHDDAAPDNDAVKIVLN